MSKKNSTHLAVFPTWLRFLIIIFLVTGVLLHFVNIDKKFYWPDEVFTSLRISGYTVSEMNQELGHGRVFSMEELHKYQYPNSEKNTIDTIKALILEESQVAPLYFVMARFWVELFGNSVAVTRSFSAFLSLLTFPCIYWLCQELFKSSLIGWIAMALVAVSPVHLIYAQEARPYTLWMVIVLISSVTLLRAMRLKTKRAWSIYAFMLPLGFYTQLFFSFVALAHGIYVVVIERFRLTKTLINYLFSLLAGVIFCVPWILAIITHPAPKTVDWTNTKNTLLSSAIRWIGIISRAFFDLSVSPNDSGKLKIVLIPFILIILSLIIYSLYYICRKTSKPVWLFVLTLSGSVALPLILIDFLFQKNYVTTRYILPSILGMELAVAYLFSNKITSTTKAWQKKLWTLFVFIVITGGVTSCILYSQASTWWNKVPERSEIYPRTAEIINQSNKPLLISDHGLKLQLLGHLLEPKVRFQLAAKSQLPDITEGFTDVFLFDPTEFLKAGIEKKYHAKLQQINIYLWKLSPKK